METCKDHIYRTCQGRAKNQHTYNYSKTEARDNNYAMKNQKKYLKKIQLERTYTRSNGYFAYYIGNISKESAENICRTRVGVDADTHWAEDQVIFCFILKRELIMEFHSTKF